MRLVVRRALFKSSGTQAAPGRSRYGLRRPLLIQRVGGPPRFEVGDTMIHTGTPRRDDPHSNVRPWGIIQPPPTQKLGHPRGLRLRLGANRIGKCSSRPVEPRGRPAGTPGWRPPLARSDEGHLIENAVDGRPVPWMHLIPGGKQTRGRRAQPPLSPKHTTQSTAWPPQASKKAVYAGA